MSLRRIIYAISFLLCCAAILHAQSSKDQAKSAFAKGNSEAQDPAQQVTDLCKAEELDPKNNDYIRACDGAKQGLRQSDNKRALAVQKDFDNGDWAATIKDAKWVTSYFPDLHSQVTDLVDRAKANQAAASNPKPSPPMVHDDTPLLQVVQNDFANGDFDGALTAFGQIKDPTVKLNAQPIVDKINLYKSYINQAKAKEQSDPAGAKLLYTLAEGVNSKTPDDLNSHIAELQAVIDAKSKPPVVVQPPPPQQSPTPQVATSPKSTPVTPKPQDDSAKIAELFAEAKGAELDGKLPFALARFQDMLKLQPGNADATAGVARVQQKISSDPQQLKLTLVGAIRDFYDSKLPDAKVALDFYLNTPQARSAGAAYFYLGATVLELSLLETPGTKKPVTMPGEVKTAFQKARAAGYKPLPQYVSPVLMNAWNSAGS